MNKMLAYILIIFCLTSSVKCFAQEVLPSTGTDKDIAVLNDELQRLRNDISNSSGGGTTVSIPSGIIVMWSGAIEDIPSGWAICDGENGTPDLTDRFIIHADADTGGTNNVGDTGGSNTITVGNLPAHTHDLEELSLLDNGTNIGTNYYMLAPDDMSYSCWQTKGLNSTPLTYTDDFMVQGTTTETGSGTDYKPKYYALAYIQKL